MTDPILGMTEISMGDSRGYLRQNERNLVVARLLAKRMEDDSLTAPPGTESKGDGFILGGAGTGDWSGAVANQIAVALSDSPTSSRGWVFVTPQEGMTAWIIAGTNTGHRVFNGTDWSTAV